MFLECWFDPVSPESCPSDPESLPTCTFPATIFELCEANNPFPAGTDNIDNCGDYDVYSTDCPGTNLVSNPCVT